MELLRARARLADTAVAAVAVLLAMTCLIPLFGDLRWIMPAATMVVVIAVLGAASRAIGMPIPFVPIVQGLGLILTITAMHAADAAWGRLVPTPESWDLLRSLVQQGLHDAQTFAAPVVPEPGVVLLTVAGVGLAALATDTLFVSVRAPLLAGLPLLALFLTPALVLVTRAPWWGFAPPAAGWLLILAADQRDQVRRWGRLPEATRVRGLSTGARRTGIVVIVLASVVALLLPVRGMSVWRSGGGTGPGGPGGGAAQDAGAITLDPLVSMRRDLIQANDAAVLSYRTQAQTPSYLRVAVLEDFDGTTWRARQGAAQGPLTLPGYVLDDLVADNPANRVTGGASFTYDIRVTNLQNPYLPLPFPISEVQDSSGLGADWQLDPDTGTAFSDGVPATGLAYRVSALAPDIQPSRLRDAPVPQGDFSAQLALPTGLSPDIASLAAQVTSTAAGSYDRAIALQRWFTRDGGFTYSTSVRSGADADYIAEFLTDRVGYCEQFAAAMAIMARTLGIPSRVVVGFTQGSQAADGTWRVTVNDAHAWPELWFDGVGWTRFEPTPRSGGTVLTPPYARIPGVPVSGVNVPDASRLDDVTVDAVPAVGRSTMAVPVTAIVVVLVLLGAGLLAIPMTRRVLRRRRRLRARGGQAVEGAWAEIADVAVDLGQPWSACDTPRQAAQRLARGMGEPAVAALERIRREVEEGRYAPLPPRGVTSTGAERAEALGADVRTVMRDLRGRVTWPTRVAAYCWPSSERRRQRSSMRSMKPGDFAAPGAGEPVGAAASSAGREPKAE